MRAIQEPWDLWENFQSDDMINSTKNDIDINDINYSLNYFKTHLTLIVSFQLKQLNQLT